MSTSEDIRLAHPLVLIDRFRATVERRLPDEPISIVDGLPHVFVQLALNIDRHHADVARAALDALQRGDTDRAAAVLRESLEARQ